MVYTLASDQQYVVLASYLVSKGITTQQATAWIRSKHSIVKGYKYYHGKLSAYMDSLNRNTSDNSSSK